MLEFGINLHMLMYYSDDLSIYLSLVFLCTLGWLYSYLSLVPEYFERFNWFLFRVAPRNKLRILLKVPASPL
jgi:hypothetical protein